MSWINKNFFTVKYKDRWRQKEKKVSKKKEQGQIKEIDYEGTRINEKTRIGKSKE